MTDLNVRLHPADEHGCGFYRMRLPARHAGVATSEAVRIERRTNGRVTTDDANVFVFQRPMDHRLPSVIEALQRQGVAVVVEIDDDLSALDPHHVAYRGSHPRWSPQVNWQHLQRCCALADLVTCTTPELAARYAGHGRSYVLPNFIESRTLDLAADPDTDLGWTGSVPSHPHDLQQMGVAVLGLITGGHTFRVVGESVGLKDALALDHDPDATGWLPLDDYYLEVGRLRVGLVPLADTSFNRCKSWLKGLEYAALGVPFTCSPTPDYLRLQAVLGDGALTAAKPRHWRTRTQQLLDTPDKAALSRHLRQRVADQLTIDTNAWRWPEAWDLARKHRLRRTTSRRAA